MPILNPPDPADSAQVPPQRQPSAIHRGGLLTIIAVALLAIVAAIGWELMRTFGWFSPGQIAIQLRDHAPPPPPALVVAPPAPDEPAYQAEAVNEPLLPKSAYAPGWPLALPGQIVATPAVADLLGDGHLEIIVPCLARGKGVKYVHSHPNPLPLLFAFRADGSVLPGWPIKLRAVKHDRPWGGWASSPSVFHSGGRDWIAITGPDRTVYVIGGDRSTRIVGNTDATVAVPIADLTGGGAVDLISGGLAVDSEGRGIGINPWEVGFGYSSCIGNANGDGKLEFFYLHYGHGHDPFPLLVGYDANGTELPNWRKSVPMETWRPPAMGDIDGTGTMSIVAGYGHDLFAWHNTGAPLEADTAAGKLTGIFKTGILAETATPALADLTGSGHADIVVFDRHTCQLHAWHADGTAVWPAPAPAPATAPSTRPTDDGTIATLPITANGVSIASLGDDPKVMDFFVGTYWIRHFPDNRITITNMLPTPPAHTEWAQPTIADLEHTGQADVIFGTTDGRLAVYRTHLAYHPERMEWPTVNGNFQHTGAWTPPKQRITH